jgi:hypothetical protein
MEYYGQAAADYFVINVLKEKRNGYFLEIGSNDPIYNNNSYKLESEYDWKGIMVEYEKEWLEKYQKHRPNSIYIIDDAQNIDYHHHLKTNNFPKNIDFLQIDLDVEDKSTINVLEKFNSTVFSEYKFAVVIFETDIYLGNHFNTLTRSREIFEKNGYIRVFSDIKVMFGDKDVPFEDWYVHPDLVDMTMINSIKQSTSIHFKDIILKIKNYHQYQNNFKLSLSEGEILDRYSILEIKNNKISDPCRKQHIEKELQDYYKFNSLKNKYIIYYKLLYIINKLIWDLTNQIKELSTFNEEYAHLSYKIFEYNQSRFRLKNIINILSDSMYKEQKSYIHKEAYINIKDENEDIFLTLIYALLNYDQIFVFIDNSLNKRFITRIKLLFPFIHYVDEMCETNLIINFNKPDNILLKTYIDNQLKNLLNPIFYMVDGSVEESIMYLSVVNEKFIETGRKGIIFYYTSDKDASQFSILSKQDYIQDYKIGEYEEYDFNLNSWRNNHLLYKYSWHHIFKSEYGVEWGKHPWIKTNINNSYKNKIVLTYSSRDIPIILKDVLSTYSYNDIILVGYIESDKTNFLNKYGIDLPFVLCKTVEDMATIINSCKLFIGTMSAALTISQATHHNTIALLDYSIDTTHNLLSEVIPNYVIMR